MRCFLVASGPCVALQKELRQRFDDWRQPAKKDPISWRAKCHEALELLLLNLITFSWSDPSLWVQVPANKDWYSHNRFWVPASLTKDTVMVVRRFFVENGYGEETAGSPARSARYRQPAAIRALPKLAQLVRDFSVEHKDIVRSPGSDLIHLKAAKDANGAKRRIPFAMTTEIHQKSDNVALINSRLQSLHVDTKLTRIQESRMMAAIIAKADGSNPGNDDADLMLDRTQTVVYRVYNNGSFDEGGRFYGPWWQAVPKEYRKHITINGQRTVELDYSSMHPTILGHRLGIAIPDGFYEFGIGTKALVKQTFNALLNAKGTSIREIDGFDEVEIGMPWATFLNAVRTHYEPFSAYFGSGVGLRLQRIDSDIAEAVMLGFAAMGSMVLPVHDSFLCMESEADLLATVMEEEFEKHTGGRISLAAKFLTPAQRAAVADERRLNPTLYRDYHDRVRQKK